MPAAAAAARREGGRPAAGIRSLPSKDKLVRLLRSLYSLCSAVTLDALQPFVPSKQVHSTKEQTRRRESRLAPLMPASARGLAPGQAVVDCQRALAGRQKHTGAPGTAAIGAFPLLHCQPFRSSARHVVRLQQALRGN